MIRVVLCPFDDDFGPLWTLIELVSTTLSRDKHGLTPDPLKVLDYLSSSPCWEHNWPNSAWPEALEADHYSMSPMHPPAYSAGGWGAPRLPHTTHSHVHVEIIAAHGRHAGRAKLCRRNFTPVSLSGLPTAQAVFAHTHLSGAN